MNPITNQLFGNNPFINLYKMVKGSQNPMGMMQMIFQQNPKMQEALNFINQNGDPKTAYYAMAKQMNADPNVIINQLKNI